jgi:SAM-dependent methyltransferase
MPTEKEVYQSHADRYEQLVFLEDYQKNLPKAVRNIRNFAGLDIVELGAGTGRLTRFLAREARKVYAGDLSFHMLSRAAGLLPPEEAARCSLSVAICAVCPSRMPAPTWSSPAGASVTSLFGVRTAGNPNWRMASARRCACCAPGYGHPLRELRHRLRNPNPPPHLNGYFDFLKGKGFRSYWIRTDYNFASMQEAQDLSDFFFGGELAEKVRKNQWKILPECTGVFWLAK